jgi:hypothetical protein
MLFSGICGSKLFRVLGRKEEIYAFPFISKRGKLLTQEPKREWRTHNKQH